MARDVPESPRGVSGVVKGQNDDTVGSLKAGEDTLYVTEAGEGVEQGA